MSHIKWPENVIFKPVEVRAADAVCEHCGREANVDNLRNRYVHSSGGPLHLRVRPLRCPEESCAGHLASWSPAEEMDIAPPYWCMTWELFAWLGHRRFARHWSVPQIRAELQDRFRIVVSSDVVEDYTRRYQTMVAARESDLDRLVEAYRNAPDLRLSVDGLQPEKGHETLYVVREVGLGRIWFAVPLLSNGTEVLRPLFERAKHLAERIGKPIRSWVSDKQDAFVTCVAEVFPGVPHRYCANHFLRDLAKPVLEADSHAKVEMRSKVRGLRTIERRMLAEARKAHDVQQDRAEGLGAATSEDHQTVFDYCAATRGILNDDQGGPLHPPGVRMAEALEEVAESVRQSLAAKKGGLRIAP
jgi:hypothetical protein